MSDDTLRDHLEAPFNRGSLKDATASGTHRNPACGDQVTLYLKIEESIVRKAWQQVSGCLLCQASASVLCEKLEQMNIAEAGLISEAEFLQWIGIRVSPGRLACCLLPLRTLRPLLAPFISVGTKS